MSETKHSPEPWALASSLDYSPAINDADGDCLVAATDCPNTADRRRIVACVNACAGIPTEALEAGALEKALSAAACSVAYCVRCSAVARGEAEWCPSHNPAGVTALRALGRLP